jgi:hypothetical protein
MGGIFITDGGVICRLAWFDKKKKNRGLDSVVYIVEVADQYWQTASKRQEKECRLVSPGEAAQKVLGWRDIL